MVSWRQSASTLQRWAKTLFVLLTMLASLLLVSSPPLLIAILDVLLPSAMLSATPKLRSLKGFSFRASVIDVPIVSAARSLLILCVYVVCDGRGPYLGITTACCSLSVGYVAAKAVGAFGLRRLQAVSEREGVAADALFLSSLAMAVAHIVVAYRTSCRERRKLIVYKIDIEAVSTYHNDFLCNPKIGLSK